MNRRIALALVFAFGLFAPKGSQAQTPPEKPPTAPESLIGESWGGEHIIVMSKEIQASRNALTTLGFTVSPVADVSKVLLHSLVRFEDGSYLELTQFIHDPRKARKEGVSGQLTFLERYAEFVLRREGGKHVGISVKPAASTTRLLRERGFEVTDPIGDNSAWGGDRSPTPGWWTVDFIKPKGVTEWLSFLEYAHHEEMLKHREENRTKGQRLKIEEHFNTATGMSEVWLAVRDLEREAKQLEKMGFVRKETVDKPHLKAKGIRFDTGQVSLVLLAPTKAPDGILATWLKKNGEGIFGCRVVVLDIRRALLLVRERLPDKRSVITGHGEDGGRGFVVDGDFAAGLFIEFWMNI